MLSMMMMICVSECVLLSIHTVYALFLCRVKLLVLFDFFGLQKAMENAREGEFAEFIDDWCQVVFLFSVTGQPPLIYFPLHLFLQI